ncbi:hypothetical protein AB9F29_03180 [Falsihalocynthiibacter sp. S25ZX9]|uniref:hypothetical protein n=1 Tax=Falsihalocynthiibacter sp. S25ZX9 TaxID=3240870 RepID=UPI003510C908
MSNDRLTLPAGWEAPVNPKALEKELLAELTSDHLLYGHTARAIAQSSESDEAVFMFTGATEFMAIVALTWEEAPIKDQPEFEKISGISELEGFFD